LIPQNFRKVRAMQLLRQSGLAAFEERGTGSETYHS
jgi:hypothetical protein